MTWRERAQQLAKWPGWRRHAPAAGAVAVHLAVVSLIAATLGASAISEDAPSETFLSIELVSAPPEELPLQAGVSPPRVQAPRAAASEPSGPSIPDPKRRDQKGEQGAPDAPGAPADSDSIYIPPSILKGTGPQGLQSLVGRGDPCADPIPERRPRGCKTDLAGRVGNMDSVLPRSKDELAQHYADYMPTCPYRVGCEPGERRTAIGTHAVNNNGPAAGGAGSLGGLHDSVGRLGFNPDHTDPGFGD